MIETWRYAVVVELWVLMFCAAYLHHGYRRGIPRVLFVLGYVYGAVLMFGSLAVVLNIATDDAPSLGARVLACLLLPLAAITMRMTWQTLRSRHRPR